MSHRVFHINAEIRPVSDAILDPDDVTGAAVRCLVPGDSPDEALALLSNRLIADGLELIETEWCVDFHETEWDNPGDSHEDDLANEARRSGEIQYGTFHTWGRDAPDPT